MGIPRRWTVVIAWGGLLVSLREAEGGMYRYTDENGEVHLVDDVGKIPAAQLEGSGAQPILSPGSENVSIVPDAGGSEPAVSTSQQTPRASGLHEITTTDAAALVRRKAGRVRLVVLYAATCPRSQRVFPGLVALAKKYKPQGLEVLAFATDDDAEKGALVELLAGTVPPFDALRIIPWRPGELAAAMGPLGITIEKGGFHMPLFTVVAKGGAVTGQWQAVSDLHRVEATVAAELGGG